MPDGECLPKCLFFNDKMADVLTTAALMKKRYCHGEKTACARWAIRAALGPQAVPADLFPNQMDRAEKILQRR